MDKIVNVGIWRNAPFYLAIASSITTLNSFLDNSKISVHYDLNELDENNLPANCPDLLILDGGEDVNPELYGEVNLYSFYSPARDAIEMKLIDYFNGNKKRISGICRGHQLLNVHFGGSLYQDIHQVFRREYDRNFEHASEHNVTLEERISGRLSRLVISRYLNNRPFLVSSLHHQAIRHTPDRILNTLVCMHRRAYVNEGIESRNGRIRGLQCHPEFKGYAKDGVLFSYLMQVDYFVAGYFSKAGKYVIPKKLKQLELIRDNEKFNSPDVEHSGRDLPFYPEGLNIERERANFSAPNYSDSVEEILRIEAENMEYGDD